MQEHLLTEPSLPMPVLVEQSKNPGVAGSGIWNSRNSTNISTYQKKTSNSTNITGSRNSGITGNLPNVGHRTSNASNNFRVNSESQTKRGRGMLNNIMVPSLGQKDNTSVLNSSSNLFATMPDQHMTDRSPTTNLGRGSTMRKIIRASNTSSKCSSGNNYCKMATMSQIGQKNRTQKPNIKLPGMAIEIQEVDQESIREIGSCRSRADTREFKNSREKLMTSEDTDHLSETFIENMDTMHGPNRNDKIKKKILEKYNCDRSQSNIWESENSYSGDNSRNQSNTINGLSIITGSDKTKNTGVSGESKARPTLKLTGENGEPMKRKDFIRSARGSLISHDVKEVSKYEFNKFDTIEYFGSTAELGDSAKGVVIEKYVIIEKLVLVLDSLGF